MKRILAMVALIVAASPLALSQTAQSQSGQATSSGQQGVEQELIRLEREAVQALIKRDISVLESFTAEDYTGTSPSGMFYTRAQALDSVTSGDYALESAELDDMKVRVYGDTAVLTGRSTEKSRYKGQDVSGQYRFIDVFVKQGGRWRVVASQATRIAQPQTQGQPNQATPQQPTKKKP